MSSRSTISLIAVSPVPAMDLPLLVRLFIARQRQHAFPWRLEVEVAEILRQLDRLVHHGPTIDVVADLDIAGQREILAQRVSFESVVGEDAPQVGLVREQQPRTGRSIHVPTGRARPDAVYRRHGWVSSVLTITRTRWFSVTESRLYTTSKRSARSGKSTPQRSIICSKPEPRIVPQRRHHGEQRKPVGAQNQFPMLHAGTLDTGDRGGEGDRQRAKPGLAVPASNRSRHGLSHAGWSRSGGSFSANWMIP